MKLNGALKPRQGASIQGSSPGVVLKKYRVQRYFKVNKNVIKSLPLNACGVNNKNSTENIIKSKNICINNQQQATTTALTQQPEPKVKSLRRSKFSPSITTEREIYLTKITKGNRVSVITKRKSSNINLNKNKIQQATAAAAEAVIAKAIEKNNKKRGSTKIDLKLETVIKIATRQTKNTKLNRKSDEKKTKLVKVLKTTLNTSKYHFAFNKKYNNNNVNDNNNSNSTPKEVNKFLFISQINENLNLTAIIWRLFIQLKLLLFSMFTHAIKHFNGNPFIYCGGGVGGRGTADIRRDRNLIGYNLAKMMRDDSFKRICLKNAWGINPSIALCLLIYAATAICLPQPVVGDNDDTFFPTNGLETTTPEFDYASRGQKKFGDKCENTLECGFPGSICDPKKKSCQCTEDLPVTNHIDKCGKEAAVNESCFFNEQCEVKYFQTECRDQRCVCRFDMTPAWLKDGSVECKGRGDKKGPETYVDPAMIFVLIGMALMFIIICVVLRLFSQARWRENRTIFNTPNPRLMNVSLLRESKLLHGQERRGSRMSVRAPSRQPSMASLRPHSPNPSLGKTGSRSNSHGSNASATSLKSTRSNSVSPAGIIVGNNSHHERKGSTYQPHQHQHQHQQQQKLQQEQQPLTTNIISNPVAETVTVEIIEPEK